MYNDMGYKAGDLSEKPLVAVPVFIWCAGNIGVLGDMARTIDTASNGIRVLQARLQQFSRAIGNMFMPILSAALPYLTAFVQVLTEGAQAIANFFGFELPKIDFSDAQITSGFGNITGAVDEATEANEKFKGSLASIDQLNIIGSDSESKNAANMGNQFDLGINLPEYDFLQGVESKTKQIAEDIKNWFKEALPWIEAVGAAIAGFTVGTGLTKFVGFLGNVKDAMITIGGLVSGTFGKAAQIFSGIAGGLAAGATSGVLFYNGIKNLITGTGKLETNIAQIGVGLGVAATAIALFVKNSNPVGAVITAIGAAVGVIVGVNAGLRELDNQLAETITYADNGGISIEGLATGYENYFDTITKGYDDIISNNAALEENAKKMKVAADKILNLTDKYRDMNTVMTDDDAETIKTNIEEIGTAVQTWLGTETSTLIDTLTTKFSTFVKQLGIDVDGLSGKLKLLQGIGESKIEQYQQQSFDLVDKLMSDQLSPDEFQNTLDELDIVTQKMKIPDITAEATSFTKALQDMQNAAVNIGDEDTALAKIEELGIKADDARAKIKEAQAGQMANLQSLVQYYKQTGVDVDFNAKMKANGIDLTFDSLFTDIEKALDQGYATELKKIDIGEAVFSQQVYSQLEKNAVQFAENKYASNGATFESRIANPFDPIKQKEASMTSYEVEYWKTETTKKLTSALNTTLDGLNVENTKEIADNFMQGMINGIIKNQSDLNNALTAVATGGLEALKIALDEHSPSKKAEKITDYLMQGLKLGVTGNQDLVFSALDYTAIQSIMRLSKLKEDMQRFNLGEIDTTKIVTDFSFKAPTVSPVSLGQQVGAAREAYEKSAAGASNSYDSGNLEATVPVTVQVFLENDMIMESVSEQFANASYRNNGKPLW